MLDPTFPANTKAVMEGVELQIQTSVDKVEYHKDHFSVYTTNGLYFEARIVIGAFGKRSTLDKTLDRRFMKQRSPYVGVKYHVRTRMAEDLVALHNFKGGYCGISKIEDGKYNLCYLASRDILKKAGNIPEMEKSALMNNPWLKDIFNNSEFYSGSTLVLGVFFFVS